MPHNNEYFMKIAIEQAKLAGKLGEVPVGAVLVKNGEILAVAHNTREQSRDPFGHAEMNAIALGSSILNDWRLSDCVLYVTLEPCCMCAGAIINSRISKVVYGASDPTLGCVGSKINMFHLDLNHRPIVTAGILKKECSDILKEFFKETRKD